MDEAFRSFPADDGSMIALSSEVRSSEADDDSEVDDDITFELLADPDEVHDALELNDDLELDFIHGERIKTSRKLQKLI